MTSVLSFARTGPHDFMVPPKNTCASQRFPPRRSGEGARRIFVTGPVSGCFLPRYAFSSTITSVRVLLNDRKPTVYLCFGFFARLRSFVANASAACLTARFRILAYTALRSGGASSITFFHNGAAFGRTPSFLTAATTAL